MKIRSAKIVRQTKETDIVLGLKVDGSGVAKIATGIPFFDHMLTLLAKHALVDLDLKVKGDVEVDYHHSVEDTGIALGQALAQALGDKAGMRRTVFGFCRWMKRWCRWHSILADVPCSCSSFRLPCKSK